MMADSYDPQTHRGRLSEGRFRAAIVVFLLLWLSLMQSSASADCCVNEVLNGGFEEGIFVLESDTSRPTVSQSSPYIRPTSIARPSGQSRPINGQTPGSSVLAYSSTSLPDNWTHSAWLASAEFTWEDSVFYKGSKSVRISDTVANDATWIQTIQLVPDTDYLLSGWVKTQDVTSVGAGANLCLWGTWTRSEGIYGTNDWTYLSMIFNSGATGEVTVGARLGFWGGSTPGTVWFDDIRVTPVEPPSPAPDPDWSILVLIYGDTDFWYEDGITVWHHVVASMSEAEKATAAAQATLFVEEDIPLLNSRNMISDIEVRFPEDPLTQLTPIGDKWWPAPADTASDLDPAFDSVMVIWDPRGTDLTTGLPINLNGAAGLTAHVGTSQTYTTIYIQGGANTNHRNIYKHEWGHAILFYFDALGVSPLPTVTNHATPGQYVHWPTGEDYIWIDETLAAPIPNSIYNNYSGFTHDYYSGTTATPDQPTRRLGIIPEAWAVGGPVAISTPPVVTSVVRVGANPTNASSVDFTVTFDKSVSCVCPEAFAIDASGVPGASVTNVSGSGSSYTVTVDTGMGDGTLSIDVFDDDTIMDSFGNLLGGPGLNNGDFTTGEVYTIDKTPPTVNIGPPSAGTTGAVDVTYTVTYTGADSVLLSEAFVTLNKTGSADATVTVSGVGISLRTVTLLAITGDGMLSISLGSGTAADIATNTAPAAGPSGAVTVDSSFDTDMDGLTDREEVDTHGTDPTDSDSDDDGLFDGLEVNTHGSDPLLSDTDGDGLDDNDEVTVHFTNPVLRDSDGDGVGDGNEIADATDPNDPESFGASEVWVDFAFTGTSLGSLPNPYKSIPQGVAAVDTFGTLHVKSGATSYAGVMSKPMTIVAEVGIVILGAP